MFAKYKTIEVLKEKYEGALKKKLAEKISTTDKNFHNFLTDQNPHSMFFVPTTREEIIDIVNNLKLKKSSGHDGIENCLLKSI